jgi:hypothetical protein
MRHVLTEQTVNMTGIRLAASPRSRAFACFVSVHLSTKLSKPPFHRTTVVQALGLVPVSQEVSRGRYPVEFLVCKLCLF